MPTLPLKKCPWKCELTNDAGYVVYSALGSFYIPMLVMLFFYWRIYRAAIRTTRAINQGFRTTKGKLRDLSAPSVFFFMLFYLLSWKKLRVVRSLGNKSLNFGICLSKIVTTLTIQPSTFCIQAFLLSVLFLSLYLNVIATNLNNPHMPLSLYL